MTRWSPLLILKSVLHSIKFPLYLLSATLLSYLSLHFLNNLIMPTLITNHWSHDVINTLFISALFIGILWMLVNLTNLWIHHLERHALQHNRKILFMILPLLENSLKMIIFVGLLSILTATLSVPEKYQVGLEKVTSLLLIGATAYILMRIVSGYERVLVQRYQNVMTQNFKSRQMYTQVRILKKVILTLLVILTIAAMLMVFENVREVGVSIFASAGVASAIVGFSAQKSLANIVACLQIAFTQPIRIGDTIVVESEFGVVEEISLTYVTIKLWDLRRLIIPLSYFIENSFENWTLNSSNIIGSSYLYVDYSIPIQALRQEFLRILNSSNYWDHAVQALHVTDTLTNGIKIRLIASARNPSEAWELRCEIREKMIGFINKHYPAAFPMNRQVVKQDSDAFETMSNTVKQGETSW